MEAYTSYVSSGIEWVGNIPESWSVVPNKRLMHKVKDICETWSGQDVMSLTMNGVIVRDLVNPSGKMPATFDGYQFVEDGDLLMCLFDIDVTPRCVGRVFQPGVTSPAYSRFKLIPEADLGYFYYYYLMLDNTKELLHLAKNLRHSFTEDQLGALPVPVPPHAEQLAISAYLDEKCIDIDAAIKEATDSAEDYRDLKHSIIAETVFGRTEKDRQFVDSGYIWIGDIPANWKIVKIKHFLRNISEKDHPDAEVLSLYRDYGVIPKNSRDDNHNVTSLDTASYKYVRRGNLVVNKMKAWQGSLAVSDYDGIISPAYYVCGFSDESLNKTYIHHLLRTRQYAQEYERLSSGMRVGQWDLGIDDFMNIPVALPDKDEQKRIVDLLEERIPDIDALVLEKEALVEELEAYKKSLIYEVVTGKRKVV